MSLLRDVLDLIGAAAMAAVILTLAYLMGA